MCACKSCPSAERPDLTVTLLVHNGKDPPEPVLIIAGPLRNTEAPNLRIANENISFSGVTKATSFLELLQ